MSLLGKVGQGFGLLFGGMNDPRLSPAENLMARKQAMLNAGLNVLSASGPSAQPIGFGQILAHGAMAGQQAGGAIRQQIGQQNRRSEIAQMLEGGATPEALQKLLANALASGDSATANAIVGYMDKMKPSRKTLLAGEGNRFLIDQETGEVVKDFGANLPQQRFGAPQDGINPASGKPEQYVVDQNGTVKWLGIAPYNKPSQMLPITINQQNFQRGQQLATQFQSAKATQSAEQIADAWSNAQEAAGMGGPLSDQTLIIALNKMLDPQSIVREGEFDRVAKTGGFAGAAQAYANRVLSKGELPKDTRKQILDQINTLAVRHRKNFRGTIDQFGQRAQRAGVDPEVVVYDPFALRGMTDGPKRGVYRENPYR